MTAFPTTEVSLREIRGRWRLRHHLMLSALWTIPAVAGTVGNYYWRRAHGIGLPLAVMALAEFPKWLIWIPLTPVVLGLGRRFRVAPPPIVGGARERRRRVAPHHIIERGLQ